MHNTDCIDLNNNQTIILKGLLRIESPLYFNRNEGLHHFLRDYMRDIKINPRVNICHNLVLTFILINHIFNKIGSNYF